MRKKSFAKKPPRTSPSSLYLIKGNSSVNEERFEYLGQVRSRDGDLGGRPIGGKYKDKKTGLILFADRLFYDDEELVKGKIVSTPAIIIDGIYVLAEKPKESEGGTVDHKKFWALVKEPKTEQEIESTESLYNKFKTEYTAANHIFIDRTRHAVSQQNAFEPISNQKLALN